MENAGMRAISDRRSAEPISQSRLRELLEYDGVTGIFRWRKPGAYCGKIAGHVGTGGYWRIRVDGRQYLIHRLAWLYSYGEMPGRLVDHINGDRADNSSGNLRLATKSQNGANMAVRPSNKSGLKGVRKCGTSWRSEITVNGVQIDLGSFSSADAAHIAYRNAAIQHFGEFARME